MSPHAIASHPPSVNTAYYVTSLRGTAEQLAGLVRRHWAVENELHWCLDVAFREDASKTAAGHAGANLGLVRRVAASLIKQDSVRGSVKAKRLTAAWDDAYEQPDKADCQMWCDPRNGSGAAFLNGLQDLAAKSKHPELAEVPWALWGHSGGGHWAGGMVLSHPNRVVAAWLRSGVPLLKDDPNRPGIKAHPLPDAALKVPVMCNLGTKEGVSVKGGQFAGVWPANEAYFTEVRSKGGLVGVAVDPLTSHECGNQRYLAVRWLDACLTARLSKTGGVPLTAMPTGKAWLAPATGIEAVASAKFTGDPLKAGWLPDEAIARAWMQYVKDTVVADDTPPPAPTNVLLKGNDLTWDAEADPESGLTSFVIERDGQLLATVPEKGQNPFGRPVFQNLEYSDTPTQPLVPMRYTDPKPEPGRKHAYRVIAVNTAGLKSKPSAEAAGAK